MQIARWFLAGARLSREDARLTEFIRTTYLASGGVYDSPKVWWDLREEANAVARIGWGG